MRKILIIISLFLLAMVPQYSIIDGVVSLSDFSTLQDAVNLVPNGGTIIVPRGIWEGNATIPAGKTVHIQGVSPAVLGQTAPRNSTQWDYLLQNYAATFLNGSILRGQINATAQNSKLAMTNVIMIGHGAGVALDIGAAGYMNTVAPLNDVSIGNYEVGVRATKTYRLTINNMQLAGVGTGLVIRDGNLNRLRDIDIIACTLGADLKGEILWQGGSVQACVDGVRIYQTAGYLGQIHFEQNSGVALVWDGYGGKLDPNFYATNGGKVIIKGYSNILDIGWAVNVEFVYPRSQYNFATVFGPYTAGGWQDRIQTVKNIGTVSTQYADTHTGQVYYPDGVIIKAADSKNYKLTVTNGVLGIIEVK
jgi:hypothetical protein